MGRKKSKEKDSKNEIDRVKPKPKQKHKCFARKKNDPKQPQVPLNAPKKHISTPKKPSNPKTQDDALEKAIFSEEEEEEEEEENLEEWLSQNESQFFQALQRYSNFSNEEEDEDLFEEEEEEGCNWGDKDDYGPMSGYDEFPHGCRTGGPKREEVKKNFDDIIKLLARNRYSDSSKEPRKFSRNFRYTHNQCPCYQHVDSPRETLQTYSKIFSTQADDSSNCVVENDDLMLWTTLFVFRVFAIMSLIHFIQTTIFQFPIVRHLIMTAIPFLRWIWVVAILLVLNAGLSIFSVVNSWGGSFPMNIFVLLVFVILWTLIWLTIACSFTQFADIVFHLLLCIAIDCLFMAAATLVYTALNPRSFTIYSLAAGAIFIQLLVTMVLINLGYIGDGTWEYNMYVICASTFFASFIFLYIVVDVNAILNRNRPIAWPHQWIFGVVSIYQDWVWMIAAVLQMLLYCFPCFYCKDSKHTVFRRWTFGSASSQ